MGTWGFLLIIILFPFIWKLIQCLVSWIRIYALHVQVPAVTLIDQAGIPEDLLPIFEEGVRVMDQLGFTYSHTQMSKDIFCAQTRSKYIQVFLHEPTNTYAELCPPEIPDGRYAFSIEFATHYADRVSCITVNNLLFSMIPYPSCLHYHDNTVRTYEEQWELHQQKCRDYDQEGQLLSPEEYCIKATSIGELVLQHLHFKKMVTDTPGPTQWRFTLWGALQLSIQLISQTSMQQKLLRSQKFPSLQETDSDAAVVAANVEAFKRRLTFEQNLKLTRQSKQIIFLISILLFALSFGLWGDWLIVPVIILVLLVHETGHYLAMRAMGYRNPQMVFLPFMGAAAIGAKDNATVGQQVFVSLMGPVPGILLGFACFILMHCLGWHGLLDMALMFLIINYFNLLPVLPLDGGHIAEQLFLSRFPRGRFFMALLSTLILVVIAITLSIPWFLFIALMFGFTLRSKWNLGTLAKRIKRVLSPDSDEDVRLKAIFFELTHERFSKMKSAHRVQQAKGLNRLLSIPPPGKETVILGGFSYLVILLLPVLIPLVMVAADIGFDGLHFMMSASYREKCLANMTNEPNWEILIQDCKNNDEKYETWMQAAYWNRQSDEPDKACLYFSKAQNIANSFPSNDIRLIDVSKFEAELADDPEQQKSLYKTTIALSEELHGSNTYENAVTLHWAGSTGKQFSPSERIGYLLEAQTIAEVKQKPDNWLLPEILSDLARVYAETNQFAKANEALVAALALNATDDFKSPILTHQLINLYAQFNKLDQIDSYLAYNKRTIPPCCSGMLADLYSHTGWEYLENDDYISAEEYFGRAYDTIINAKDVLYRYTQTAGNYLLDLAYIQELQFKTEERNALFHQLYQLVNHDSDDDHEFTYPDDESGFLNTYDDESGNWLTKREEARTTMYKQYETYSNRH